MYNDKTVSKKPNNIYINIYVRSRIKVVVQDVLKEWNPDIDRISLIPLMTFSTERTLWVD